MPHKRHDLFLGFSLVFAVFLWGANNVGTKVVVGSWPPIWTGSSRFLCAGVLLAGYLRLIVGNQRASVPSDLQWSLWVRGGLSLAIYIVVFNFALQHTTVSHVAVYLGAAPIWALLWEGMPVKTWQNVRRYGASLLALSGVLILFWPSLKTGRSTWLGESLGLAASILWTNYGRQCRVLSSSFSAPQVTAGTMWRAGMLLMPLALVELVYLGSYWSAQIVLIQLYCVIGGGVMAFGIWNYALKSWPASQVLLFNNLIPLSSTGWAAVLLDEPITSRFWVAVLLVITGVLLGQANWQRLLPARSVPPE